MLKEVNVFIAGTGGQGVIMMSELLGEAAVRDGLPVRSSDVLGMAVRGGPVISTVRFGHETYASLIPIGKCDIMLGMEPVETLRNIVYLHKSSVVILNTRKVVPVTVFVGECSYPSLDQIVELLKANSGRVISLDAYELAKKAGNERSANIVLLGAGSATGLLPLKLETIKQAVAERFSSRLASVNLRAFDLGYEATHAIL